MKKVSMSRMNKSAGVSNVAKISLTVWKTINLGNTTADKLIRCFKKLNPFRIKAHDNYNRQVNYLIRKAMSGFAPQQGKVDLVILSLEDLGFTVDPCTRMFLTKKYLAQWSRKNLVGFEIKFCSPAVGPQLRDQYRNQPDECLYIAMEPLIGSDSYPHLFTVEGAPDGRQLIMIKMVYPDKKWGHKSRLVFQLEKTA